jgi:hypothetical protein
MGCHWSTNCTGHLNNLCANKLPDIAQVIVLYKAEAYTFWFQYIAPILLKGQLPDKYYK